MVICVSEAPLLEAVRDLRLVSGISIGVVERGST